MGSGEWCAGRPQRAGVVVALAPDWQGLRVAMAAATAAAPAAASGGAAEPAPKQTLYLNNLNEKVKRGELKKTLYATFSQFGRIMQIICKGSFRLKGQAWIIFDEVTAAAAARRQLNNCPILGKPMVSRRKLSEMIHHVLRSAREPRLDGPRQGALLLRAVNPRRSHPIPPACSRLASFEHRSTSRLPRRRAQLQPRGRAPRGPAQRSVPATMRARTPTSLPPRAPRSTPRPLRLLLQDPAAA